MAAPGEEQRTKLQALLNEISAVDPETDLVRAGALGQANFRAAVPTLEQTIDLFSELSASDLTVFPATVLGQLIGRAEIALKTFDAIRQFSLEGQSGDVMGARDALVQRAAQEYDQHFTVLEPHVNYLLVKQTDFAALEEQARAAMTTLDNFTRDKQAEQEAIRSDMEETLATVKAAAAEAGVGQQSIVFAEQSRADADAAVRWLQGAVALGVVTVAYIIIGIFVVPPSTSTTAETIAGLGGRLVVLSVLAFALGFALRQYAAAKHNQTVNLHRQNALRTFETFVRATDDKETKDAVLLEATRSIFSAQSSGYLKHGNEPESPSTIIEVVRRMATPPTA